MKNNFYNKPIENVYSKAFIKSEVSTQILYGEKFKIISRKKDLRKINHIEKNYKKIFKFFLNTKYLWGGKSYKGIDCSALVQVFFNHNNKYCPRDSKDQEKYFKKKVKLKNIRKNDMIFWKGHVAIALSKNKLIHAYGPKKKVLIMSIKQAIYLISKTARLEVKKSVILKTINFFQNQVY